MGFQEYGNGTYSVKRVKSNIAGSKKLVEIPRIKRYFSLIHFKPMFHFYKP